MRVFLRDIQVVVGSRNGYPKEPQKEIGEVLDQGPSKALHLRMLIVDLK
jgi:hypothetical protein